MEFYSNSEANGTGDGSALNLRTPNWLPACKQAARYLVELKFLCNKLQAKTDMIPKKPQTISAARSYRFSGHETFSCRYAWLPKAAQGVAKKGNQDILTSAREDDAMIQLGVGKNMVRSIRFWSEAADILETTEAGHKLTDFGCQLLVGNGDAAPLDPFLEDIQTLWLIHWKLATNKKALIFAWDFLLNQFQEPELYASTVLRAFQKAATQTSSKEITAGSLEQLYEVFLHSYVPTRGSKGEVREDNLDCPLAELDLLQHTGFTKSSMNSGRLEPKYSFRREEKTEISHALFAFCLDEFWRSRFMTDQTSEQTLPFHTIVSAQGSPGQVFKIPEADIRTRLFALEGQTDGFFRFEESAAIPRVVRQAKKDAMINLLDIYQPEVVCG